MHSITTTTRITTLTKSTTSKMTISMDDNNKYVDKIDDNIYNIRNVHNYTDGSNIKNDTNIDNVKEIDANVGLKR